MGMWLYAKRIVVSNAVRCSDRGPMIIAANHPNSFFDAVVIALTMQRPISFIARGDVFAKPAIAKLLRSIHLIPIFRIRDGREKLSLNEATFLESERLLKQGAALLVFVEGFCVYQTSLQLPLKKGAPRMLVSAWQHQVPARVLPVWLHYNCFQKIGKTIHIRFGEPFGQEIISGSRSAAVAYNLINNRTASDLLALQEAAKFHHNLPTGLAYLLMTIPAIAGALIHAPLYLPVTRLAAKLNKGGVFYDGIVFGMLLVFYPLYLLLVFVLLQTLLKNYVSALALTLLMPLLARVYVLWKK